MSTGPLTLESFERLRKAVKRRWVEYRKARGKDLWASVYRRLCNRTAEGPLAGRLIARLPLRNKLNAN